MYLAHASMLCSTHRKLVSTKKGKHGEDTACRYLKKHGYEVVDRNRRLARGELDIVAVKDEVLVFVEVKSHKQRDAGLLAMHTDKCERFISAANTWLGLHEQYANYQCRFDLILVQPHKLAYFPSDVEHMQDMIRL